MRRMFCRPRISPVSIWSHISSAVGFATKGTLTRTRTAARGLDPGRALPAHRPRPLVVRVRPPRAGADEARQPAAPVPRQVHPAVRRGAARAARARRGTRARPVRRLGDDARAGARVGLRRDRRGRRAVQLPADAGEDARVQPVRARVGAARGAGPARRLRRRAAGGAGLALRARLVRAQGRGRAALLPLARRGLRARRRAARRARAGGAFGSTNDAFRPRLPAHAAEDAVLVPQAPARVQARGRGATLPAQVCARHAHPGEGVRARAGARARGGRAPR